MKLLTLAALAFALAISGCNKADEGGAPPPVKRATIKPPTPAPSTATAAADSIGVPECDSYLKNYEDCVSTKVPEASRAALKTSLDQTREAWKKSAADANGKAALGTACKQMTESAKTAMKSYGCNF
ncbi:MAG TPA: hypothetical protein VGR00_11805 [Thermoanaerobaculia bacterium]|nr:hypothetical protein [Thermoanaerobaculia bacterium]